MISSRVLSKALLSLQKKSENTHTDTMGNTDAVTTQFISFLKRHNLLSYIPAILRHLKKEAEKEKESNTLTIHTPFPISKPTHDSLRTFIGAPEESSVEVKLDKEVIGGFVAYFKDIRVDASIKNTLTKLETKLLS